VFPLTWVSYLTIFILLALGVLVLTATIRGYGRKDTDKNNKWMECFNVVPNLNYFSIRKGETLNAWDGVRSLAMMWVVIGHVYSNFLAGIVNLGNFAHLFSHPFVLIILSGILSVDVFFALGGFFLAFIILRQKIKVKLCLMAVLQRVLRIWPAFILAMMFYYSLAGRFGSGPFWDKLAINSSICQSMWREILFVSNFI
jgi:peptidoglycan/LPS O-acetylase OafA/YrhL